MAITIQQVDDRILFFDTNDRELGRVCRDHQGGLHAIRHWSVANRRSFGAGELAEAVSWVIVNRDQLVTDLDVYRDRVKHDLEYALGLLRHASFRRTRSRQR